VTAMPLEQLAENVPSLKWLRRNMRLRGSLIVPIPSAAVDMFYALNLNVNYIGVYP
jgi:hypothetical protein